MSEIKPLTYRAAGVDVEAGNEFVRRIKPLAQSTRRPGVLGGLGGFSGFFDLASLGCKDPVLVASNDGVGTKLKIAFALRRHDTIGIDLVAMVANDLLVTGAQPLFFLDYYASGHLEIETGVAIVKGIAEGCRQAGMALLGGETAEMPGLYQGDDYDLAGFGVGIVERSRIIDGSALRPGLELVGLSSSGLHSNGYSLARKALLEQAGFTLDQRMPGLDAPLGEVLLTPTRIYAKAALAWSRDLNPRAMSHITGGGFPDNIARLLPEGVGVEIRAAWPRPAIFDLIQQAAAIDSDEMYRTFNMGIGYVGFFETSEAERAIALATEAGEKAWRIGRTTAMNEDSKVRIIS